MSASNFVMFRRRHGGGRKGFEDPREFSLIQFHPLPEQKAFRHRRKHWLENYFWALILRYSGNAPCEQSRVLAFFAPSPTSFLSSPGGCYSESGCAVEWNVLMLFLSVDYFKLPPTVEVKVFALLSAGTKANTITTTTWRNPRDATCWFIESNLLQSADVDSQKRG